MGKKMVASLPHGERMKRKKTGGKKAGRKERVSILHSNNDAVVWKPLLAHKGGERKRKGGERAFKKEKKKKKGAFSLSSGPPEKKKHQNVLCGSKKARLHGKRRVWPGKRRALPAEGECLGKSRTAAKRRAL